MKQQFSPLLRNDEGCDKVSFWLMFVAVSRIRKIREIRFE